MRTLKMTGIAAVAAALAFSPSQLDAQQLDPDIQDRDLRLSVRAGPSMPAADLAEITNDFGTAIGAELALPLNQRVSLSVDGNIDMFDGATVALPNMRLWHYGAGVNVETTPEENPWSVICADEEETSALTALNGSEAFGTAVTVPLTAQVNVRIPNN